MVWHSSSPLCPCNPEKITSRKQGASGRGGRHQGYKTEITYRHNMLVDN